MTRLLLAALLVGCGGCVGIEAALGHYTCPSSGGSTPAISEQQLRAAWEARIGKLPAECDTHWIWQIVSDEQLLRSCGLAQNSKGEWKPPNACTIYTLGWNGTRDPGCPLSLSTAKWADSKELNTHEFGHWACWCSKRGEPSKRCLGGGSDPGHTDPRVWGTGGFDGSFGQ